MHCKVKYASTILILVTHANYLHMTFFKENTKFIFVLLCDTKIQDETHKHKLD